jgi:5-hydroxyisourate hydrolase
MATLSSHLLNSVDGTHASGVKVIIYQINSSGEKKIFSKLRQMKEEEF